MAFLQPYLLWGALAVIIPVVIHFWHQKKGKLLAWAATQWLVEKNQQQQRGLKLDNVLLLVLRCLLLIVLVVLLSQLVLNNGDNKIEAQTIHLVQPNALVTTNFRFELEEAEKRGDKLYWINERAEPVQTPDQLPETKLFTPLVLQAVIDKLRQGNAEMHLYLLNNEALADVPAIYVPATYRLHLLADSSRKPQSYLVTRNNQKLFVNQEGRLTNTTTLAPTVQYTPASVHSGALKVLLDYRNKTEQHTVAAALDALEDVYGLNLSVDREPASATAYDWVLTDHTIARPMPQTLYIISGKMGYPTVSNVVYSEHAFTPQTNERVAAGQLPEWLGEQLIRYYGLQSQALPLSEHEVKKLFVVANRLDQKPQTLVHNALLLLFIVLLIVERWIALTRNA
ncbi:BatA domain-containing protein [Spirosoma sp. SC4-14]|uniref:BatA domain-containing protein n=1 Tax=Spirosoma sp. SC4-14 TaxID=3128900 RepID=UPI0030CC6CD8